MPRTFLVPSATARISVTALALLGFFYFFRHATADLCTGATIAHLVARYGTDLVWCVLIAWTMWLRSTSPRIIIATFLFTFCVVLIQITSDVGWRHADFFQLYRDGVLLVLSVGAVAWLWPRAS